MVKEKFGFFGRLKKVLNSFFAKSFNHHTKSSHSNHSSSNSSLRGVSSKKSVESMISGEKPSANKKKSLKNRQLLRKYLDKAGFEDVDEFLLIKNVFKFVIYLCLIVSLGALVVAIIGKPGVKTSLTFLLWIWTSLFAIVLILAWLLVYVYLDIRIMKRAAEIEAVLPDFLQLTSANISAGMPLDRALWFAVRPNFGILAKEIEEVAKATISGNDLGEALINFADKYDSKVLRRSVNLLLEGMRAGGEMADLISKIALNIQNSRIMKKEMAANVTTYVIFIGFASAVAAPILFALSGQLLIIIQKIISLFSTSSGSSLSSVSSLSIGVSSSSISSSDFNWFSYITLFVSSLFSGMIISVIRKGSVKEGWRFIPVIVLITIIVYVIASSVLSLLLGGIISFG